MLGFSKSYPYYFYVKQGEINSLASATDADRLILLQKIAGLDDFIKSKEKSFRLIDETNKEIERINEYLRKIDIQLHILENEEENIKSYRELDRNKQIIAYLIHVTEVKNIKESIVEIEYQQEELVSKEKLYISDKKKFDKKTKALKNKLKQISLIRDELCTEKSTIEAKHKDFMNQKQGLDIKIVNLQHKLQAEEHLRIHAEQEMQFLCKSIDEKSNELKSIDSRLVEVLQREKNCSATKAALQKKYRRFFINASKKKPWNQLFFSTQERDKWIHHELQSLNIKIGKEKNKLRKCNVELEQNTQKQVDMRNELERSMHSFESLDSASEKSFVQYPEIQNKKELLVNEKR